MTTVKKTTPKKKTARLKASSSPQPASLPSDLDNIIKAKTEELLAKIGFQSDVTVASQEDGRYEVKLQSDQPNLLIGYHGQTLSALQLILGLAIQKETSLWVPITVDVGSYREHREEQLRRLAINIAQRVRFSGQPQSISRLSAAERRIVHLALAEDEMIETISEGEGPDRHLVIRPKTSS